MRGRLLGYQFLDTVPTSPFFAILDTSFSSGVAPWNTSIPYGWLLDGRDGKKYRTLAIGSQTWMAQNLNFPTAGSVCYNNSIDSCDRYGRLYKWAIALQNASPSNSLPSGVTGICPVGWHIPADSEWSVLVSEVLQRHPIGLEKLSRSFQASRKWQDATLKDALGFRALPAGTSSPGSYFNGTRTYWWTTTLQGAYAVAWGIQSEDAFLEMTINSPPMQSFSVRCVNDTSLGTLAVETVSTPVPNVAGGSYQDPQLVTLTSSTPLAVIYYTTDGTLPNNQSSVFNGPISISSSQTLRAFAQKPGLKPSGLLVLPLQILHPRQIASPVAWNSSIPYDSIQDSRDSLWYRTLTIGQQTWMAENLRYAAANSRCMWNNLDSCAIYGRLYDWATPMAGGHSSDSSQPRVRGICPANWHLPSASEWKMLQAWVLAHSYRKSAGLATAFKSTSGWFPSYYGPGEPDGRQNLHGVGDDSLGFRALASGDAEPEFEFLGTRSYWWTSTEQGQYSLAWGMHNESAALHDNTSYVKQHAISVRCLSDLSASVVPVVTVAPIVDLASGTYIGTQSVQASSATPGALVYYTTDGSTPTFSSPTTSGPISINSSREIKAFAAKEGVLPSGVKTFTYTIQ